MLKRSYNGPFFLPGLNADDPPIRFETLNDALAYLKLMKLDKKWR
jgi:hypothetical protein